jgi:hypothetical protein
MALTNAEKQAAYKQRKDSLLTAQQEQISELMREVISLREQLDISKQKTHSLELKLLRAQLKTR